MSGYAEVGPAAPGARFEPRDVVAACFEGGSDALLLDHGALPPDFFDLSTGVAGDLVQRLTQYGIRMAAVVPDPSAHSERFREFAAEANRGHAFRFFPSREEAARWLESAPARP